MKTRVPILLALCACVLAVSCRKPQQAPAAATSTAAAAPARPDSSMLRVALLPTLDCLPFYYAARMGIYDTLRLPVSLRTFDAQADCDTALLGTSADVAASDLVTARLMRARGSGVTVVAATDGPWSLVVSRLLRVRNLSQARDRLVAVARQSYADYLTAEALEKAGMGYGDVFRPQINALSLRLRMLDNDQVDLSALPEPQASAARAAGHRVIYTGRLPMGCIAVRAGLFSDSLRVRCVAVLLKGYARAVEELNEKGKAAAVPVLRDVYKLSPAAIDSLPWPKFRAPHAPAGERVDAAVSYLRQQGLLGAKDGAEGLINRKFLD